MEPLRRRHWFQDAYIRVAALVAAGIITEMTPPNVVDVIEGQLERAYQMGRRDERAAARRAAPRAHEDQGALSPDHPPGPGRDPGG